MEGVRNLLGVRARSCAAVVGSLLDCREDMGCGDQQQQQLAEVGSNLSRERSVNRWDGQWKAVGYRKDCSYQSSTQSLLRLRTSKYANNDHGGEWTHVACHALFQPSCGLSSLQLHALPNQQLQRRLLSLLRIVRGSYFGFDFDCHVFCRRRRRSRVVFDLVNGFVSQGQRKWHHFRILLKQVHLLCFHAYYGCAQ